MHKYWRHLGDYAKKTRHLTMLEHGAFTLLLDWCYDHEKPLPEGREAVFRLVGARAAHEKKAVWGVLNEFFTLSAGGWVNGRVQAELVEYQGKSEKTRSAAAKRWQSERNADACGVHDGCNASRARSDNQQPATNNQQPSTEGAALPRVGDAGGILSEEISIENVGAEVSDTVIPGLSGLAKKKEGGGAEGMLNVEHSTLNIEREKLDPEAVQKRGSRPKKEGPEWPEDLAEGYREVLGEWWWHKREMKQGYSRAGWLRLVRQQRQFPVELVRRSVETSMTRPWAGLFTEKLGAEGVGQGRIGPEKKWAAAGEPEVRVVVRETGAPEGWGEATVALYEEVVPWAMLGEGQQAEVREWLAREEPEHAEA